MSCLKCANGSIGIISLTHEINREGKVSRCNLASFGSQSNLENIFFIQIILQTKLAKLHLGTFCPRD